MNKNFLSLLELLDFRKYENGKNTLPIDRIPAIEKYKSIIWDVASTFNLSHEQIQHYQNDRVVILITALPFLACSDNPEQDTYFNLLTYIASTLKPWKEKMKVHMKQDFKRIERITQVSNGNKAIVKEVQDMLNAGDLLDSYIDVEIDKRENRYNPFALKGAFSRLYHSFHVLAKNVLHPHPSVAQILTITTVVAVVTTAGWWQPG